MNYYHKGWKKEAVNIGEPISVPEVDKSSIGWVQSSIIAVCWITAGKSLSEGLVVRIVEGSRRV